MNAVFAAPILLGVLGTYWLFWQDNYKSGRGLSALAATVFLGSAFFFENIIGLLFVCVAESIIVIDRFLMRRKISADGLEREFSGLFLLSIPFFVFLSNKLHVSFEVASALLVVFFFLRLLKWPQKLPFEGLKETRFHNDFVMFWCNAAIFYLCRDLILIEHSVFFAVGAVLNAIVGFASGSLLFLLVFLSTGFISATSILGPAGLLISLGRKWFGVVAAILAVVAASNISMSTASYYSVAGVLGAVLVFTSLYRDQITENLPKKKQLVVGALGTVSASAIFATSQEELFLVEQERWIIAAVISVVLIGLGRFSALMSRPTDMVQWDWQGTLFNFIIRNNAPVGKETRELPEPYRPEVNEKPPGTLGQYLLWMFVLVFFLLLGGQS